MKKFFSLFTIFLVISLGLTACNLSQSTSQKTGSNLIVRTNSSEPTTDSLIPTHASSPDALKVMNLMTQGLYQQDQSGNLVPGLIESFHTNDQQNFTVKIQQGKKFDQGEEVKAASFVKSWTYGALAKNRQSNQDFFKNIEGYSADDLALDRISGLKIMDDYTFTVKLKKPSSDFKILTSTLPFSPMSEQILKNPMNQNSVPIGNGPYKCADQNWWQKGKAINLVRNDLYDGVYKAQNKGITFTFYSHIEQAYEDVKAGKLDVLDHIPESKLSHYQADFPHRYHEGTANAVETLAIPAYVALTHFQYDEEGILRRQAISKAINREEIVKKFFPHSRVPATGIVPPSVPGYDSSVGAQLATYDPVKAKDLWNKANAINTFSSQTLTVYYNDTGQNKQWLSAVMDTLKNTFNIEVQAHTYPNRSAYVTALTTKETAGIFRSTIQGTYPSLFELLVNSFQQGGQSNRTKYSNTRVGQKLTDGLQAHSVSEAVKAFNEAQAIILNDGAAIPIFYYKTQVVWSPGIHEVRTDWTGAPIYSFLQG